MLPAFENDMITTVESVESMVNLAIVAGKQIVEVYETTDLAAITELKDDHSPLTLADKLSHEIIYTGLQALYPHIPVLSEEGRHTPYQERKSWQQFWLVDPLDGTKEFIKRNGEFTVNIALIRQNYPVFGVIYAPIPQTLYVGSTTGGAFKREKDGIWQSIRVSGRQTGLIAAGSRSHADAAEADVLRTFDLADKISIGSSLKFCLLAEGKADVYYRHGPTMEWDTAAGQAIVEAAGGKVLDVHRQRFAYNKPSLTNSSFLCLGR